MDTLLVASGPQPARYSSIAVDPAKLDRLAEVAVRVGLNLAHGQELVLTAPLEAVPLVRRITEHAYRAGARWSPPCYADDEATLARFQHAPDDAFDSRPAWLLEGMASAFRGNAARLAIAGEDPALLAGQDPDGCAGQPGARSVAYRPALELITNFAINWTIVCLRHAGLGTAGVPGRCAEEPRWRGCGRRSSPPPASTGRPGGRLGRAQRRAAARDDR